MKRLLALLIITAAACTAGVTGKLAGRITDASTREPLIGANIMIVGTGFGASVDVDGNYTILNLPPGEHTVRISCIGYDPVMVEKVRIIVDQTTQISMALRSSSVQMGEVVVTAQPPAIQRDLTSTISVVSQERIEALPIASFTDLLSLQAGVVGSGSNLHVRGGRSNEVSYLIDGAYVQDPLLGGLAAQVNNDAIEEMSFLSGTFNAEYGNALSGVVNIVTREGTESFRGKVEARTSEFGIARYSDLHESRVTGTLSGPLLPGMARFFLTAEQNKRGSYLPFGYDRIQTFLGKISIVSMPMLKWTLSGRGSRNWRQGYNHSYKYIPEMYTRSRSDNFQGILTATHTVERNLFYDAKASYFNQGYYSGIDKDTSQYVPEGSRVLITTVENGQMFLDFYRSANPATLIRSRTATVDMKADAVWQIGTSNEVKFGIQYKQHWLRLLNIAGIKRPSYLQYIDNYYTDKPFEASAYAQDKIEYPYLIVNLGLRFDYLNANVKFRNKPLEPASLVQVTPRTQLSPRIGIAHPISDRTKLHFAYGHFFQNPEYQYMFENKQYKISVREPIFGQPGLDAQRTVAYEIGITHQLAEGSLVRIVAYYKDVTGLLGTRYYPAYEEGRYTAYTLYINEDYANSKGLEVNVDMKPDKYFTGGLTYTYSVAKGNASSEGENYGVTYKATLLTPLDFDKTHVFNATATFRIPKDEGPILFGERVLGDVDITAVARAGSGYPYTPAGRSVGYVTKNSLRLPGTYVIDLEVGKEFSLFGDASLRIFAEVLNVTDHRNVLYVYTDTGDPDVTLEGNYSQEYMRDPSNYGSPRSIRLGASARF